MTRAKPKVIVTDPTPMRGSPAFIVKAYSVHDPSAPSQVTMYTNEASAFVKIESLQRKMKARNGTIARAELIDCRPNGTLTNLDVHAGTKIEWSWSKAG